MAATVEATFRLVDRASGTLGKLERKALAADKAMGALGEKLDKLDGKLATVTASAETTSAALDKLDRTVTPKINLQGAAKTIAEAKIVDKELGKVNRTVTGNVKGRTTSRALTNAATTEGTVGAMGAMGIIMKGVAGTVAGAVLKFAGLAAMFSLLAPAILSVVGALIALGGSLVMAIGGIGILGGGLLGAFAVGLGSVMAIVIPAIKPLGQFNKAMTTLNKAIATGDPRKIKQASQVVNDLAKKHPGISKLYGELQTLKKTLEDIGKPVRSRVFDLMASGVKTASSILHNQAKNIRANFGAAADAVKHLFAMFRGKEWESILKNLGAIFRTNVGNIGSGIERAMRAIGNLVTGKAAQSGIKTFTTGFANMMEQFNKWAKSSKAQAFTTEAFKALRAWGRVAGGLGNLLLALSGASSKTGRGLLDSFAKTLNSWANVIKSDPKKFQKWLDNQVDRFKRLVKAVEALGGALSNLLVPLSGISDAIGAVLTALSKTKVGGVSVLEILGGGAIAAAGGNAVRKKLAKIPGFKGKGGALGKVLGGATAATLANGTREFPFYVIVVSSGTGKSDPGLKNKGKGAEKAAEKDAAKKGEKGAEGEGKSLLGRAINKLTGPLTGAGGLGGGLLRAGGQPLVDALLGTMRAPGGGEALGGLPALLAFGGFGAIPPSDQKKNPALKQLLAHNIGLPPESTATSGRIPGTSFGFAIDPKLRNFHDAGVAIVGAYAQAGEKVKTINAATLQSVTQQWNQISTALTTAISRGTDAAIGEFQRLQGAAVNALVNMGFTRGQATRLFHDIGAGGEVGRVAAGLPTANLARSPGGTPIVPSRGAINNPVGGPTPEDAAARQQRVRSSASGSGLMGANPGMSSYASLGASYGLAVTSGLRRGAVTKSGNRSLHSSGDAIDMAGSPADMLRFARFMATNYGSGLDELIYTPMGFGIKNGRRIKSFGAAVDADHFDHVHVGDRTPGGATGAPGGAAGPAGALVQLHARRSGVPGVPGVLADAASQIVAQAASNGINAVTGAGGGGGGRTTAGGQYNKASLASLWVSAGGNPAMASLMASIALAESGGNAGIVNSIGATGLWQIHPGGKQYLDPMTNAQTAVQKLKTQGLGAWEAYTNGSYKQFTGDGIGITPTQGPTPLPGTHHAKFNLRHALRKWAASHDRPVPGLGSRTHRILIPRQGFSPNSGDTRASYIGGGGTGDGGGHTFVSGNNSFHVGQVVVYGNDRVKDEVKAAFHDLAREFDRTA